MYQIGIHLFHDRDLAMAAQFRARTSALVVPVDKSAPRGYMRPMSGDDVADAVITSEVMLASNADTRALMEIRALVKARIDKGHANNGYPMPGHYWLVTWWHS